MKRKTLKICICLFAVVFAGLVAAYLIYGSALVNPADESDLVNDLTLDEYNPPEILSVESGDNKNLYAVTYFDNSFEDTVYAAALYRKSVLYKNKYVNYGSFSAKVYTGTLICNSCAYLTELENGKTRVYFLVRGIIGDADVKYELFINSTGTVLYTGIAPAGQTYSQLVCVEVEPEYESDIEMDTK